MRTARQWIGALIISLYPKEVVDGVRVIFSDITVDRAAASDKLQRAINQVTDAGRYYDALIKRIRKIVIWPGNHTFADGGSGVHIASDLLVIDDLALASVLVHEAVHLRISAHGIRYAPAYRERIERLCIAEQARFLRRVPGPGEQMAREAELCLASPWWTREERESNVDELLKAHRLPKWLRTVILRRDETAV